MGRILYLDCYSGASGDMLIGALLDAGLPFDTLRAALGSLALEDECRVSAERVSRSGIGATKFTVTETTGEAAGTHRHRHLPGITKLVDQSALSDSSKQRANRLFRRLAETEATIHQMPVEKVHLHEVGALDSIVDIVGGVFALEWFGADRVVASPINVGSGTVTCEHGTLPVPAPATASLVSGVPVYAAGPPGEMLTPTGALLVTEFAGEYGPLPRMRIEKIGYGAGSRDPAGHPNVLRVLLGKESDGGGWERIVVVECEIDDMNPQIFGVLMDRLYAAGAVDVFFTAVQMKKNRPGTHVTVLVPPEQREAVSETLFRDSTTIGVRHAEVTRETLRRELVAVSTSFGEVRCKVARRDRVVLNVAPEFDDCARLAEQHGVAVKEVYAVAVKAYQDAGIATPASSEGR
ncbi:MAG: nickel pincer cofactor biosynthesis protein LarC [Vicinamibacterales bacterium]|nr:nickel pincer cofactor biosynthesis protein LarC [Vicinamibacterales bacterium]